MNNNTDFKNISVDIYLGVQSDNELKFSPGLCYHAYIDVKRCVSIKILYTITKIFSQYILQRSSFIF